MLREHEVSRPESLLYRSENIIVHLNLLENILKSTIIQIEIHEKTYKGRDARGKEVEGMR